jgi:PAS domain S-box-containing protein
MMSTGLSVLLIEDRPVTAAAVVDALSRVEGSWRVTTTETLAAGLEVLAADVTDCVLVDLGLADGGGTDSLVVLADAVPRTVPVIALAGDDVGALALEAVHRGAQDCLLDAELDAAVLARSISYAVERAQIRDALARREARYVTLIDSLDEGILVQDEDGRVLEANPAAARILGIRLDELLRDPPVAPRYAAVGPDGEQLPRGSGPGRRALQTGQAQLGVVIGVPGRSRGTTTWIEVNAVPLDEGDRGGKAIVSSFRDITERRRLEDEARDRQERLLEAERLAVRRAVERNAAEATNRAKTEFLSRMSHELRTPLNAVLGFAQILQLAELGEPHRSNVDHIRSAGEHLLSLIDDVLDIARIEAGKLRLSLEAVDVAEAVARSVALIGPQAAASRISIVDASGSGVRVLADRQRLQQVLLNLLSNAVKYNHDGGSVRIDTETSGGTVTISVIDTGIGIAEADLERLFTPFERLSAEGSPIEGTGVGLALSRALSQQMGGTLTAFSAAGRGSTFTLELRAPDPPATPDPADRAVPVPRVDPVARPVTVLAIEDNPANIRLLEAALAVLGEVTLRSATSGQAGLDLASEVDPDLILLDLHLPDVDGDEVMRRLRAAPATAAIPVVICSADASPARRRELVEGGAAGYLAKPIELDELFAIVRGLSSGS